MGSSILQKLKNKAGDLLMQSGRVLEVRHWDNAAMTEIDLHLPEADMTNWTEVPYIKFKVADFTFRDYTPFGWDADTRICSLLVDTAHEGPGALWARSLKAEDNVRFMKAVSARQSPHATDLIVGLGDASSLAHLLALQQLTLPVSRFIGAVMLANDEQRRLFSNFFASPLTAITSESELTSWLAEQAFCRDHTRFYLAGNNHLVSRVRRWLRDVGLDQVKAKGFWS